MSAGYLASSGGRRLDRRPSGLVFFSLVLFFLGALSVVVTSFAFACTAQAAIRNNKEAAQPGEEVTGRAWEFSGNPAASEISLHLDGRDGQVLWKGRPDVKGNADYSFIVPDAPGNHVLAAYQTDAAGQPVPGTPARTTLTIEAPPAPVAPKAAVPPPARAQPAPAPAPAQEAAPPAAPPPAPAPVATAEEPVPSEALVPSDPPPASPPTSGQGAPNSGSFVFPAILTALGLLLALGTLVVVTTGRRPRGEPAGSSRS